MLFCRVSEFFAGITFCLIASYFAGIRSSSEFMLIFGADSDDDYNSGHVTSDGGYITCGTTNGYDVGSSDVVISKFDSSGIHIWSKTYGLGTDWSKGIEIQELYGGGYILTGWTFFDRANALLMKVTSNGTHDWTRTLGGSNYEEGYSVTETMDGFVLSGYTTTFGLGGYDILLSKFSSGGAHTWTKTIGGVGSGMPGVCDDFGFSVLSIGDGKIMIAGESECYGGGGGFEAFLTVVDAAGDHVWSRRVMSESTNWSPVWSLKEISTGGYILCGHSDAFGAGGDDILLTRFEEDGSLVWSVVLGGGSRDYCEAVSGTSDGGFILIGNTQRPDLVYDVILTKINSNGTHNWTRKFGGIYDDYGLSVQESDDGGFYVSGITNSFSPYNISNLFFSKVFPSMDRCNWTASTPNITRVFPGVESFSPTIGDITGIITVTSTPPVVVSQVPDINFFDCDFECFGAISSEDDATCSGRGDCVGIDSCRCEPNYFGSRCEVTTCDGILSNDTDLTCSGHGSCVDNDTCVCDYTGDYTGEFCDVWTCDNISRNDVDIVCGGHGACVASDSCFCMSGYNSKYALGPCTEWYCGVHKREEKTGCNDRGVCISSNMCRCTVSGYAGTFCESWSCGFPYSHPLTCNGHGSCMEPKVCDCSIAYGGNMCEDFTATAAIVVPLVVLGTCGLCCLILIIVSVSVLGFFICFLVCSIIFLNVTKLGTEVKKFGKLKNFDILLKEQQLEDDTSIAHIRMHTEMYNIDFDELKIEKMLGEGGSAAVVFKAQWKKKEVAFKCFKTRLVMSSQQKFDDFEKEVQVLSSLKHPNIVQFFGATCKPPRVGIVMEYCEHGDINAFLKNYQTYELKEYDQNEKIRIIYEISLSMGYLHSRSIVHRDLKCENVLINSEYSSRLMDFGLSKIVDRMSQVRTTKIGTNIYMAPEVISSDRYNEKCDVFSFAILIYILITELWEPYGTNEMMVELKVSSDPNFRPEVSELDQKLEEGNEWIREVVVKNWNHSSEERDSFRRISEIFEAKRASFSKLKEEDELVVKEIKEDEENNNMRSKYMKRQDFEEARKYIEYLRDIVEKLEIELNE